MKTDPQIIHQYLDESRYCAMLFMAIGTHIQKELPPMTMSDELREKLNALCTDLIGTKHDLFHEIFEIDELMSASPDSPAIAAGIERMQNWMMMAGHAFRESVDEVDKAAKEGTAEFLVQMLLMSYTITILNSIPSPPVFAAEPEPEPEDTEEDEDDDDEDADDSDPNCYAFYSEDSYPVGTLIKAIRGLMDRPDITDETTDNLKVFLFAMQRLPLVTPGVHMSLGLRLDQGGESAWIEIRMGDGEFSLGRGTWIDGDADTETIFEVTPDYREGDAFLASQFAESFTDCARDVCREVIIEDWSDGPFTGWDLAPDKKRWNDLSCSFL